SIESDGPEKQNSLDAFAGDHQENKDEHAQRETTRGGAGGLTDAIFDLAFQPACGSPHPYDHCGPKNRGDEHSAAFQPEVRAYFEAAKQDGSGDGKACGSDQSYVGRFSEIGPSDLLEVPDDYRHDQCGLDAFAQGDDQ